MSTTIRIGAGGEVEHVEHFIRNGAVVTAAPNHRDVIHLTMESAEGGRVTIYLPLHVAIRAQDELGGAIRQKRAQMAEAIADAIDPVGL